MLLRSGGECRQGQEVCGEVQQTPCIRSKQFSSGLPLFPVLVAAVAVDLAADFAARPARAVNVHVSSACTDRRDQFVEFSSADAAFVCEVSYIGCRDGARYRSGWRRTGLSAGRSIAEVRAKEHADGTSHALLSEVNMRLLDRTFEVCITQFPVNARIVIADTRFEGSITGGGNG